MRICNLGLLIILAAWFNSASSATIPYPPVLVGDIEQLAKTLIEARKSDSNKALVFAHSLFSSSSGLPNNAKGWSINVYSELLLFNDSIAKAEELLLDSNLIDWLATSSRIQDYHTLNLGRVYAFNGKYLKADSCFRKVINHSNGNILKIHGVQAIAENLRYQGKLDQSLVRWYEALKLSEEIADSSEIVQCYLGRGTVRFLRDELEKAKSDFEFFYAYNSRIENRKELAVALSFLGLVNYKNRDYEACIEKNLAGYDIRKSINDLKGQGESLNNLALGYMGMKNWNQALQYLQEAIQIKTRANDLTQMTVILNNTGHCYLRLSNESKALDYFDLALVKGTENGQMGDVLNSYQNIIDLYKSSKNYALALNYQTELITLKDSLADEARNQAIHELEVKYETENKEQEIILLKQDRAIVTNRWLTLALALFLALIIGILFIDSQKRKHRQEKLLMEAEDELQKAELKNMSSLLEFNQNKLSLYTENLLRKNELVGQLESRLKNAVDFSDDQSKQGKQLIEDFSSVRILTDQDWTEFKSLFNRVHHGLLDKLINVYSDLTLGEQRLFLLMKLDLSTKEIANILGVSPESIKKGRYRLKKKIGIDEATTLQEFVNQF
jgi:tetratricopeptide (TPR) repeat protein